MFSEFFLKIARFYLHSINRSEKVRDLLMWPIASRVIHTYKKPIFLKSGVVMKTDLRDILGRTILFYGPKVEYFWEPQTVRLMSLLIKDAKEALVAGSHLGYLVLAGRKAMQNTNARVHTFEPVRYLFEISQENFTLNENLGSIVINHGALSDRVGEADVLVDNLKSHLIENKETSENRELVSVTTLDQYARERKISAFNFILLDVEGYELQVFKGMEDLFIHNPPRDIIFEMSPRIQQGLPDFSEIKRILNDKGYTLYYIEDNYTLSQIPSYTQKHTKIILRHISDPTPFLKERYFNILATKRSNIELCNEETIALP